VAISLDQTAEGQDLADIISVFAEAAGKKFEGKYIRQQSALGSSDVKRTSNFLTHPVFNTYHSESDMMRYINVLRTKICRWFIQ